jgi:hypothetical protein
MKSVFGDLRLDKRLGKMQEALSQTPKGQLTQVWEGWSSVKAGYNFLK